MFITHINMQEAPEEIMTTIIILRARYKPDSIKFFIYKIILFNSHCKSELSYHSHFRDEESEAWKD